VDGGLYHSRSDPDPEGIAAKRADGLYTHETSWVKIKTVILAGRAAANCSTGKARGRADKHGRLVLARAVVGAPLAERIVGTSVGRDPAYSRTGDPFLRVQSRPAGARQPPRASGCAAEWIAYGPSAGSGRETGAFSDEDLALSSRQCLH
jgi:hypothetical protein